jgi:6-phosphogluconolactonase
MILHLFKSNDAKQEYCIKRLCWQINQLLETKQRVVIAVSGGKSPIPFFQQLSTVNLDFTKITFTLVDDRIVANDHEDSNENLVKTYLLQNNAKLARYIGLVTQKLSAEQMVQGLNQQKLLPDVVILGMGEDGHIASIFPECAELKKALDLNNSDHFIVTHPKSAKYTRISMTLKTIINAKYVMLNISGSGKYHVLANATLNNNEESPIAHVLNKHLDTNVFWSKN